MNGEDYPRMPAGMEGGRERGGISRKLAPFDPVPKEPVRATQLQTVESLVARALT